MGVFRPVVPSGGWRKTLRIYSWWLVLIWTLMLGGSLILNYAQTEQALLENARIMARTAYQKDLLYRRWNASFGGVYVPITEHTQPNPYLNGYPGQNMTSTDGTEYTLINPAYMTRMVFELQTESTGIIGHITSLNPIRPENGPDEWEAQALARFEAGDDEASGVVMMDGQRYLRLMRPLYVEENCLTCHAKQGYVVGQVRGGISQSVPLDPLEDADRQHIVTLVVGHSSVWLAGLVGIVWNARRLQKTMRKQVEAEEKLVEMSTHDALTGLYNRGYLEHSCQQVTARNQFPASVLVADIDDLKSVNDRYGHAAGDDLIRQAASMIKSCFRDMDVVARTGGDEFMGILPSTDEHEAGMILKRLYEAQEQHNSLNPEIPFSISIGMATTDPDPSLEATRKLADSRMYQEKVKKKKS
jgi:diguanylate cyclase (GGDEF)-like protein